MQQMSIPVEARSLTIHFGTSFQLIKFFPAGPRDDLLAGIREVMGVQPNTPLRFRDADGDVVILSPLGMPDGSVLHVTVESGILFRGVVASVPTQTAAATPPPAPLSATLHAVPIVRKRPAEAAEQVQQRQRSVPINHAPAGQLLLQQQAWQRAIAMGSARDGQSGPKEWRRWDRASGGDISLDGLSFSVGRGNSGGWSAYTPVLPTTGQHYFAEQFGERPCCVSLLGVISSSLSSLPHNCELISKPEFPFMISLAGIMTDGGPGNCNTGSSPDLLLGVLFDMDNRTVTMVPHDDPLNQRLAVRLDNVPVPLRFALAAPKHDMSPATIKHVEYPSNGVFQGESARFAKRQMR